MTDREAFEAWHGGHYRGLQADIAWAAYQAALASERAKQAEPVACSYCGMRSGHLAACQRPPAVQQQAEPVGKVVAAVSSENDPAMIQWTSDYRPTVGDLIYAAPPAIQPLTAQQLDALIESHCGGTEIDDGQYSAMVIFAASVERAHGIGTDHVAPPAVQAEPVACCKEFDSDGLPMTLICSPSCNKAAPPAVQVKPQGYTISRDEEWNLVVTEGTYEDDEAVRLLTEVAETVPNMSIELEQAINAYLVKVKK